MMRNVKAKMWMWVLPLAVALAVGTANAALVFSDDFETGHTVGSRPSGWSGADQNGSTAFVEDFTTNKVLRITEATSTYKPGAYADGTFSSPAPLGGQAVEAEFEVMNNRQHITYVQLREAGGLSAATVQTRYSGGVSRLYAYSSTGLTGPLAAFSLNTWHKINIDLDMVNQTYDVLLNDILVANDLTFHQAITTQVDTIRLQTYTGNSASAGSSRYDDVSVNVIPEPATVMLLGVGGSLLALRRRR